MSLRQIGKKVISDLVEQAQSQNPWKVLVVDDYALKILSTATKFFALTDEKISVIERLSLKRKPLKEMEAIYVCKPEEDVVNRIIQDFDGVKRLYAACHIFFLTTLPDELFEKLSGSPVAKFIKTFKEANYEFMVAEANVFTTDVVVNPKELTFTKLYSQAFQRVRKQELARIGRQVATLCATLGEYPIVRYSETSMSTSEGPMAKIVAASIQEQIDQFYRVNPDAVANDKARAILLVLDRSFDLVTPLVHEFSYQAMVYDLIDLDGNKFTYDATDATGKTTPKVATLDEEDEKWVELRHVHIAGAMTRVSEEFNKFVKDNQALASASKAGGEGKKPTKDIGAMVRAAPQYLEQLSKFTLHINLSRACYKKFSDEKIEDLATIEQGLATRETADGDPYKPPSFDEMIAVLTAPGRTNYDKLRVVLLYAIFRGGLSREEKQAFSERLGFKDQDNAVIEGLNVLGIRPDIPSLVEPKKGKKKETEQTYELSRYVPKLKKILEKLDEGELSVDDFPYLKEVPLDDEEDSRKRGVSMRTAKSNWAKGSKKDEGSSSKGHKVIVFVAGGITASEMRSVYEITSRDVYLGSTHIIKPKEFLDELRTASAK